MIVKGLLEEHSACCKNADGSYLNTGPDVWMENISILSFSGNDMSHFLPEIYITIYCQERALKLLFGRLKGWAHISIYLRSSNMDCSREQLWLDSLCSIWPFNICTSEADWHMHVLCEWFCVYFHCLSIRTL